MNRAFITGRKDNEDDDVAISKGPFMMSEWSNECKHHTTNISDTDESEKDESLKSREERRLRLTARVRAPVTYESDKTEDDSEEELRRSLRMHVRRKVSVICTGTVTDTSSDSEVDNKSKSILSERERLLERIAALEASNRAKDALLRDISVEAQEKDDQIADLLKNKHAVECRFQDLNRKNGTTKDCLDLLAFVGPSTVSSHAVDPVCEGNLTSPASKSISTPSTAVSCLLCDHSSSRELRSLQLELEERNAYLHDVESQLLVAREHCTSLQQENSLHKSLNEDLYQLIAEKDDHIRSITSTLTENNRKLNDFSSYDESANRCPRPLVDGTEATEDSPVDSPSTPRESAKRLPRSIFASHPESGDGWRRDEETETEMDSPSETECVSDMSSPPRDRDQTSPSRHHLVSTGFLCASVDPFHLENKLFVVSSNERRVSCGWRLRSSGESVYTDVDSTDDKTVDNLYEKQSTAVAKVSSVETASVAVLREEVGRVTQSAGRISGLMSEWKNQIDLIKIILNSRITRTSPLE